MVTDEIKREIEAEIETCPTMQCAGIKAMEIVQSHCGWVSDESLHAIAKFVGMTVDELDGVATFHNRIYRKQVGRHIILICDSVTCWIMGFDSIRDHLSRLLGIRLGETTADGRFTMLPIQCLGACDQAPALMIDEELYTNLDAKEMERILANYK